MGWPPIGKVGSTGVWHGSALRVFDERAVAGPACGSVASCAAVRGLPLRGGCVFRSNGGLCAGCGLRASGLSAGRGGCGMGDAPCRGLG